MPDPVRKISAVILAGGRGQRMNGQDKGLVPLLGRPMIAWVLERIAPQVDELFISANRNLEQYRAFGYLVLEDTLPDFPGPLAGLHRAMEAAAHPLILCAPCDTPFLPSDLAARLLTGLEGGAAEVAVPFSGGRAHPAICLVRRELRADLGDFLSAGGRRVGEWQRRLRRVEVPFEECGAFLNINTPAELQME
ncbi:MAG: molybdenum cofactor guanylyltransferase MobA [Pseudomonadota bacterium]|jgi:molybdopterin-guanine dinucleotide biosynthesis protein A